MQNKIISTTNGVVYGLPLNTIGEVARTAESILTIVPEGRKLVESIKIAPDEFKALNVQRTFNAFYVHGNMESCNAVTFDFSEVQVNL